MQKFNKQKHKDFLIELYQMSIDSGTETDFMVIVLNTAIHKLENNIDPKSVENWVALLEKCYMSFTPKHNRWLIITSIIICSIGVICLKLI